MQLFIINNILLGVGLAMDAFSVSMANGLNEPNMKKRKSIFIAFVFGAFQAIMPMTGWVCVHTIVETFKAFERFIPWIALILLAYIGGKMIKEGLEVKKLKKKKKRHFLILIYLYKVLQHQLMPYQLVSPFLAITLQWHYLLH